MSKERTRMDMDAFTKAFNQYFLRKYKSKAHSDKDANQAVRDFIEDVSNVAGNPQVFESLMRRYELLLKEYVTVFARMEKYSPTFMKDLNRIEEVEYKYTIGDVVDMTDLESRTAIRKRAADGDVDCIGKKLPAGGTKYYFSEKGVHQLLQLIKPRPGAQKKNKSS
ncbi:MAG: hypothetical protein N4A35_15220 [Flavobacteriales bacterium]|jgi:hypothetical protein|nr:hypothetical protein [Flavobacteriales bacterium]